MKKLLILLIALVITSCSLDSEDSQTYQVTLPIDSIALPQEFTINETYEILVTYTRPTSCHAFNDIYHVTENNERTIAVISTYFGGNSPCEVIDMPTQATFNFSASEPGTYVLKFWQGTDDNGQDIYLTEEVLVVE